MKRNFIALCSLPLAWGAAELNAAAQGTVFTYQGRLADNGNAANGIQPLGRQPEQ